MKAQIAISRSPVDSCIVYKVYVPRVEEVQTKEYDSDDDDEAPQHTTTVSYDDEYG